MGMYWLIELRHITYFRFFNIYYQRHDFLKPQKINNLKQTLTNLLGTLMGYKSEGNVVEVVDCFAVTHSDNSDTVLLDQDYHRRMVGLRKQVRD